MTGPATDLPTAARRYVDLHLHSTASDGSLAPAEVAAAGAAAGLIAIALTDHDTLAGVADAQLAGSALGIRVVAGVELSAEGSAGEVHVLGLHVSRIVELENELAVFRDARRRRAEDIVARLNALGVLLTMDLVLENAGAGAIGRPHIARAMVAGGWVRDFRDAFDRYLGWGRPAYVPKQRLAMADAIALIHRAGGLAVLAHPGSEAKRNALSALAALGLDGVEVLHPSHTAEDAARISALADHLELVPSGGSDWHGQTEGARAIGAMRVPLSFLERQDLRVERRAAGERVA
jgi:3',5'-nucleoside bisphosphate phosphatase